MGLRETIRRAVTGKAVRLGGIGMKHGLRGCETYERHGSYIRFCKAERGHAGDHEYPAPAVRGDRTLGAHKEPPRKEAL